MRTLTFSKISAWLSRCCECLPFPETSSVPIEGDLVTVADAQLEVRSVYMGGFVGQLVSGTLWLISCALTTWISRPAGIAMFVFGGMFIFPVTQLVFRSMGRPASLSPENPFRELAMEVAFIVPLMLPVVGAAALHRVDWFYPAAAVVVGAHYLPFAFLYGMRLFIPLSGILVAVGVGIGFSAPAQGLWAGWVAAGTMIVFAFLGRHSAAKRQSSVAV
jgi:hypothetical protein